MSTTVSQIKRLLKNADEKEFAVLERSLVADTRKGVRQALEATRRRLTAEAAERERLSEMYEFQAKLLQKQGAKCAVGLDEVGRGPLAGPLAVGAVVLPEEPRIEGLKDSKQLSSKQRESIAAQIKEQSLAWAVEWADPQDIDAQGISACLRVAFARAVAAIEAQGIHPDLLLLDGLALHFDKRECNIIKGDARCASIGAASIVAKVERDALMKRLDKQFPAYGFAENKGYASKKHIEAIKREGLCAQHRVSFCTAFTQESLF